MLTYNILKDKRYAGNKFSAEPYLHVSFIKKTDPLFIICYSQ